MNDEHIPTDAPRAYALGDILPVAGVCMMLAFVSGVILHSCASTPAPAYHVATLDEMQKAVALDKWARGVHGPRLKVRAIGPNGMGATYFDEVELAGDWVNSLGKSAPPMRWLMPVTVGADDDRQVGGMLCLVDDVTALAYMRAWVTAHPKPSATEVRP